MSDRKPRKKRFAKLALFVLSAAVGLALVELGARVALGPPGGDERRLLFFGPGTFAQDVCGAVHYAPKRTLRTIAIYGRSVAYDVRFTTNDMGYVDAVDYAGPGQPRAGRRIAFVGDSFTAGYHAGGTWLMRLREATRSTHPDLELYNLGVDGTGLAHFLDNVLCFLARVPVDEVVVLFISDDLRRVAWVPRESADLIHMCYPADCSSRRLDLQKLRSDGESQAELLERARKIYEQQAAGKPAPKSTRERLERSSHIARLVAKLSRRLSNGPADDGPAEGDATFFTAGDRRVIAHFLQRFRESFAGRKLTFMHLPQKSEVRRRAYLEDVSGLFAEQGLTYVPLLERCEFSKDGFLERDAHPNERGYAEIAACVRSLVGL